MNGQRILRVPQARDVLLLPPSAKTVSQEEEEMDALEAKRSRRLTRARRLAAVDRLAHRAGIVLEDRALLTQS